MEVEWNRRMEQVIQQARRLSRRVDALESTVAKQGGRLREQQTTIMQLTAELRARAMKRESGSSSSKHSKAISGRGSEWSEVEEESDLDSLEQCSLASDVTADITADVTADGNADDSADDTTANKDMNKYRDADDVTIHSEEKVTLLDVRNKSQQWVEAFRLIINKVKELQRSMKTYLLGRPSLNTDYLSFIYLYFINSFLQSQEKGAA